MCSTTLDALFLSTTIGFTLLLAIYLFYKKNVWFFISVFCNTEPFVCFRSWEPISKYINEQYEKFLKEEVNITRKKRIPDTRMHCCLYFISPTGHSWVTSNQNYIWKRCTGMKGTNQVSLVLRCDLFAESQHHHQHNFFHSCYKMWHPNLQMIFP